mgnify:CR=1 FL=1
MMKVVSLFFTGLMLCTVSAIAQPASDTSADTNMEILKQKLKADKKLLVAGNMDLSDAEAKKFWPVYDAYQKDLEQVNQKLAQTIKDYAEAFNKGSLPDATAKKLLNDTEDSPLSIAIELEGHCYSRLRSSDDFREGVEAFHAKRSPKFTGS